MTVCTIRITGDSLVQFVNAKMELVNRGELTRTDMIKDAGYVNDNGTGAYVDFYTELLRAKGISPVTDTDMSNAAYDDLPPDTQHLYDVVDDKLGEKWDHDEVMDFIEELDDIGITTGEQFEDCFEGVYDDEKEFAQYWVCDVLNAQIPECVYNCIDWEHVWSHELKYDFNCIEFDYNVFIFRNN